MQYKIPEPMKVEHDELHADLVKATQAGGRTGDAARAVANVLHHHFHKEEAYALPPLGMLGALAAGQFRPEMAAVLELTDRFEAELPQMLAEHQAIVAELHRLIAAATSENRPDIVDFAEQLMLHARAEEEVAYPAALLVGREVKARLAAPPAG